MTHGLRVIAADGMKDPKGNAGEFMASIVADVNDAWARKGVAGCDIVAAEWKGATGFIFLDTIPGAQSLTVGRVSAFLKAEQGKIAKRTADGMGKLL
ncbi:hypothetical protein NS365_04650 [Aureimonas ureilytica]|uniref:Uncharacterized protein n=1 Tax=Aureimonas ureilytica TaxID=401562 RepID=A0A175RVK5_9HYPH|nr:hypothetical protein [Aureimonas ureilytica]KTR07348.1 hypothetical protein NS365_04650 [Aureimonas ureilytica]